MAKIDEISCPKCKKRVLLKFAKRDGIQCKKCYYFIPRDEMISLISGERKRLGQKDEDTKSVSCPKCASIISYMKITDGGVMCKKCYNWIPLEEEEPDLGLELELQQLSAPSPPKEKPYIIGEKIEDIPDVGTKIPILPAFEGKIILPAEDQSSSSVVIEAEEEKWYKTRKKSDVPSVREPVVKDKIAPPISTSSESVGETIIVPESVKIVEKHKKGEEKPPVRQSASKEDRAHLMRTKTATTLEIKAPPKEPEMQQRSEILVEKPGVLPATKEKKPDSTPPKPKKPINRKDLSKIQSVFSQRTFDIKKIIKPPGK